MNLRITKTVFVLCVWLLGFSGVYAQKVAYIASHVIRERFEEAKQAQQRVQSLEEEWKRELDEQQRQIEKLELEIQKNRLIWNDAERSEKEKTLEKRRREREEYARKKFGVQGDYDIAVTDIYRPVEEKIYAAIQEVSANEGYDIVWDKSIQPLVYLNPKYDLTVKVMKRLGIKVDDLEEQQQKLIENDPRNKEPEKKTAPRRRARPGTDQDREITPNEKPATKED